MVEIVTCYMIRLDIQRGYSLEKKLYRHNIFSCENVNFPTEPDRLFVEASEQATLSDISCLQQFHKFRNGEFDVEDKARSRSSKVEHFYEIQEELARTIGVTQQTQKQGNCLSDINERYFASYEQCSRKIDRLRQPKALSATGNPKMGKKFMLFEGSTWCGL